MTEILRFIVFGIIIIGFVWLYLKYTALLYKTSYYETKLKNKYPYFSEEEIQNIERVKNEKSIFKLLKK